MAKTAPCSATRSTPTLLWLLPSVKLQTIIVYNSNRDADIPMWPDDDQSKDLLKRMLEEDDELAGLLCAPNAEEDFLEVWLVYETHAVTDVCDRPNAAALPDACL